VQVIERPESGGPATARDQGWRAARGALIAFTDDDCVPEPEWLEAGIAAAGDREDALVQGRTEPPEGEFERLGALEKPFTRTIRVRELDPAFQTCNVFYARPLLERIGGFDTAAFGREPGGEDSDLAWRAIEAGAEPVFCDAAVVRHAVNRLGPLGKLRVAARWTVPLQVYARHPELRRAHFTHAIFWKHSHYLLVRALLGAVLPRRLRLLAPWLAYPYLRQLIERGRVEGGGPLLAPFYLLHDLVELATVVRAAIRYRTPML
jgi:GT2 family glycosyltransferase